MQPEARGNLQFKYVSLLQYQKSVPFIFPQSECMELMKYPYFYCDKIIPFSILIPVGLAGLKYFNMHAFYLFILQINSDNKISLKVLCSAVRFFMTKIRSNLVREHKEVNIYKTRKLSLHISN